MALQVANGFKKQSSPCPGCDNFKQAAYPECNQICIPLQKYLLAIGDIPFRPTEPFISEIHEGNYSTKTAALCTPAELLEAREKILQIKKILKIKHLALASRIGIDVNLMHSIARKGQRRTSLENYQKIMGFQP
jgi:hypothetical protein